VSRRWPWLLIALAIAASVWHAVDFPSDLDDEFPRVVRPTFSRRPPPAYRLAEPGDTIDRIAIYASAGAVVFALMGTWLGRKSRGLWPAALGLSLTLIWYASSPGPGPDGWHGLSWRAIFDATAPLSVRLALAFSALLLTAFVLGSALAAKDEWGNLWREGRRRGIDALLGVAVLLIAARQFEIPGVEPIGYWPRSALVWGILALDLALLRAMPSLGPWLRWKRWALTCGAAAAWFALVVGGIWLAWYHRPLARLRTVVPGKIYMSAMPTARGLAIAQGRHHFKTIINLFPEDTAFRSPRLPEELKFARDHGIRYYGSPANVTSSNGFLDQTLALARDPNAWPILVHCHGCVDRTPAWVGIYRFVKEGRPLDEVMREIERHRGYRPKASVILLYNRVLQPRAPERYKNDPTAALLKACAVGTPDPYETGLRAETERANRIDPARVTRRAGPPAH
jgi:hypothetical protein